MRLLGKSFTIVLIVIVLLFISAILSTNGVLPNNEIVQAAELSTALLGIFLAAHYELQKLEKTLREDRQREIRKHMLNALDKVEDWLDSANSVVTGIAKLRELSEADETDGKLMIASEKITVIMEQLIELHTNGYTVLAETADINKDLASSIAHIWTLSDTYKDLLREGKVPDTHLLSANIAEGQQVLERVRIAVHDYDTGK